MKQKQFEKHLRQHGPNLETWPQEIRKQAREALGTSPELQNLVVQEEQFEEFLQMRPMEEASPDLAERIIGAAGRIPQKFNTPSEITPFGEWLKELWNPKPAFALALVLVMGFGIGYLSNRNGQTNGSETDLASLLYNDEALLWVPNSK